MNTSRKISLFLLIATLAIFSSCTKGQQKVSKESYGKICKKEERKKEKENPIENEKVIITDSYQLQTFEFDAATGGEIVGSQGTRLTFPPLAFQDSDGFLIDTKIRLELKEYFVDVTDSRHNLQLRDNDTVLHDYSFELRAYEKTLPLVFVQQLDVAALME